jgi:hypothetical protein
VEHADADEDQPSSGVARSSTSTEALTSWKEDISERARRIWEFWRMKGDSDKLPSFAKAARLVVLVQVSSASVERVFSQVKLLFDTIKEKGLQDNIEVRLYERLNVYGDGTNK